MTVSELVAKWRRTELRERQAAQEHFLDLCRVFDHPTPAAADPTGEEQSRILDGKPVATINANLTSCADITTAAILAENQ